MNILQNNKSIIIIRLIIFFILAALIPSSVCQPVYAVDAPSRIRAGLEAKYKDADSIPIGNTFITLAIGNNNGLAAICGTVSSSSGFRMIADNNSYLQSGGTYTDFNQAMQAASSGNAAVAVLGYNSYGLYYQGGSSVSSSRVSLMDGSRVVAVFDASQYYPWVMDGAGGNVKISDRSYRGCVEFGRYTGKKITPVNVLSLDEYLYSVVASEMPSKWNIEAIKAQAVAARSYTLTRMGVHKNDGYDICDKAHCQNYIGAGNEAESTNRAVSETSGMMVYYDGAPINATYFSSSGGYTANSENVWTNAIPYLRGVKEIYEYEPKIWTRSFSLTDITNLLVKNNFNIGSAVSVAISSTGPGGRVTELKINGTQNSKTLYKEEIRNFFTSSAGVILESSNFTIVSGNASSSAAAVYVTNGYTVREQGINAIYAISSSSAVSRIPADNITVQGRYSLSNYNTSSYISSTGNEIVFSGSGYGHGVGMSQHGAEGMARMGYNFKQILEYYYTGAVVR